ncbi:MAG: FAD-dependent oxidoreductase [Saprospiraceae bacterium]
MNLTTGYPYSLITHGLPYQYPKLDKSIETDIVIVGGGISGAITAYYLTEAGLNCILVDARTIGLGSTCASTSLLQYELDTSLYDLSKQIGYENAALAYRQCADAIDTLQDVAKKINFSFFEKKSSLYFASNKHDTPLLKNEYTLRKRAGLNVDFLEKKEIQQKYGFDADAGILSEKGASTDAYMLTHALLQSSIKKGLIVFDRTEIKKIKYGKNGLTLLTPKNHIISARKMVNATGYEITEMIHKKIVKLSSTYVIASEQLQRPVLDKNTICWNTSIPYLYMRTTYDNRIIVGGRDEPYTSAIRRDKLIKTKSKLLKRDFEKIFPETEFNTELSWAGIFGSTKDSLPYIGLYDKTPHTYYALGFGGNGITFSVIAAQIIRAMLQGIRSPNAELYAFDR